MAKSAEPCTSPPASVVVTEGAAGTDFFVILDGKARVDRHGQKVAALGPGGFFGDLALLDRAPRNATVIADTELELAKLGQRAFDGLLDHPGFAKKLLAGLARRLRQSRIAERRRRTFWLRSNFPLVKRLPLPKPHQLVLVVGVLVALGTLASGIAPRLTEWAGPLDSHPPAVRQRARRHVLGLLRHRRGHAVRLRVAGEPAGRATTSGASPTTAAPPSATSTAA